MLNFLGVSQHILALNHNHEDNYSPPLCHLTLKPSGCPSWIIERLPKIAFGSTKSRGSCINIRCKKLFFTKWNYRVEVTLAPVAYEEIPVHIGRKIKGYTKSHNEELYNLHAWLQWLNQEELEGRDTQHAWERWEILADLQSERWREWGQLI
jgi:hypothetical protein